MCMCNNRVLGMHCSLIKCNFCLAGDHTLSESWIIIIISQLTGKADKFLRDLLSKQLLTGRKTLGEGMEDNKKYFVFANYKRPFVCAFLFWVALLFKAVKLEIILKCTLETR